MIMASKLYEVNATIIIFVFLFYCNDNVDGKGKCRG